MKKNIIKTGLNRSQTLFQNSEINNTSQYKTPAHGLTKFLFERTKSVNNTHIDQKKVLNNFLNFPETNFKRFCYILFFPINVIFYFMIPIYKTQKI